MERNQRRLAGARQGRPVGTNRGWQTRRTPGSRVVRREVGRRSHAGRSTAFFVVAAIYALVATGFATAMAGVLHTRSRSHVVAGSHLAPFAQQAKYLVLIVLDGARPDYFGLTSLPNVDALRSEGVQYTAAFDGFLESETPAGHTVIATGTSPARNGILGFDWAQNDSDYSLFSPDIVRAGAMEQIMESANVPTIAGLFKKQYPNAKVVALSGHKYYAADPMGGPSADAIMYYQGDQAGRYVPVAIPNHMPPAGVLDAPGLIGPSTHLPYGEEDTLATKLALAAFARMHQQITLINLPEFDWPLGHVDGSDRTKTIELMKGFDQDLGMIKDAYRKAGVLDKTLFVITADHGMTPLTRFVHESVFTDAAAKAGTTIPSIAYSTATYMWLTDTSKSEAVAQNILSAGDPGIQSVYYLSTAGSTHYVRAGGSLASAAVDSANQYLLATLMNGHEPAVVAFCKSGASSVNPDTHWKADHGGANWQSQQVPLILAGAGMNSGQIQVQPAQLEDIAPTVLTAMGVKPVGMEGRVLTEALIHSSKSDQGARAAEVKQLQPVAGALRDQEQYDTSH